PTGIYTLSLHDALPIFARVDLRTGARGDAVRARGVDDDLPLPAVVDRHHEVQRSGRGVEHQQERVVRDALAPLAGLGDRVAVEEDRKSTRLNSSHVKIS